MDQPSETLKTLSGLEKATFEDKVRAVMREHGYSRERAERIVGAMVREGGKARKRAIIVKADSERRLLTAVTNVVRDENGRDIVDHDGDVIEIGDLEEAFIDAFGKGGENKSGAMHEQDGGADIAMYFTISRDEWDALAKGGYIGKEIGIVKIRINDDRLWADVKAGKYPEVSIEGDGVRTPWPTD